MAEFACNLRFPDTSMEAIRLIRQCARVVSERAPQFADAGDSTKATAAAAAATTAPEAESSEGASTTASQPEEEGALLWRRGWMPILYELFRVINKWVLAPLTSATLVSL